MRHMLAAVVLAGLAVPAAAQQVGEVGVDWLGNDIIVEAVKDPKIDGVTCHVSYFERGMVDRLQKGIAALARVLRWLGRMGRLSGRTRSRRRGSGCRWG